MTTQLSEFIEHACLTPPTSPEQLKGWKGNNGKPKRWKNG